MKRLILILVMVLMSSSAWAGQAAKRMLAVMGTGTNSPIPFTVNSYTAITSDVGESGGPIALNDTGTENGIATGAGDISVKVYCTSSAGNQTDVILTIDAVEYMVSCVNGETKSGVTLSHTVTAGTYNIRVHGTLDPGSDYFSADTFRKPKP